MISHVKRVTIRDVASAAGVSIGAVSKVLHGNGSTIRVGEATADRIRRAAESLQYRPNPNAQSLRSGRTQTIQIAQIDPVLFPQNAVFFTSIIDHLVRSASERNYSIQLGGPLDAERPRADAQIWLSRPATGPKSEKGAGIPQVGIQIDGNASELGFSTIRFDEQNAIETIVASLKARGLESVALAYNSSGSSLGTLPGEALRDRCSQLGIQVFDYQQTRDLIALVRRAEIHALIVWSLNDSLLVQSSTESVRPDILVVGLACPTSTGQIPALDSYLEIPVGAMARAAIDELIDRLEGAQTPPRDVSFTPSLRIADESADC